MAALSTNIGWAPGAIMMNASDYARAWGSQDASAYNVLLAPGVSPCRRGSEIERALGPRTGLGGANRPAARRSPEHAQPPGPRTPHADRHADPDRRDPGDGRGDGATWSGSAARAWPSSSSRASRAGELWRTILLESVLLVGVGCLSGAVFGLYGQQLLDRALANVIDFPVVYSFGALVALTSLSIVTVASVVIVALPGYLATGVPPAVALQD